MKRSSRLWWLHGAILLSAVIGCKNCGNSGGGCGAPAGGPVPSGTMSYGSPTISGGPTMYSSGAMPTYQGTTTTPSASSFPSGQTPGYTMPNMSSGITPGAGGIGR